ncbi:hypothetical protein ACO22_07444 [Paracoccidioides brasiliensis]|uniref:GRF-type domain-containing protein n=1 Tax=Paracoccidioides brasiliensis TaxID=121759 RepID=A0A1D2J4N8_PARBR|nr:hypothetical protein ACO22_07444 [Paracoccidioides brasiliensis]
MYRPPPTTPSTRDAKNQSGPTPLGLSTPSRRSSVPLRGLFVNAVWYCNCEPRRPADHFETKNGGRNHGRWFYTCSKPQGKRCNFFLWDDEAVAREGNMMSVLKDMPMSKGTGPGTGPDTGTAPNNKGCILSTDNRKLMNTMPTQSLFQVSIDTRTGLLTPNSGRKRIRDYEGDGFHGFDSGRRTGPPSKRRINENIAVKREESDNDGSFGWDDDLEGSVVQQLSNQDFSQQRGPQEQIQGHQQPRQEENVRPRTPRRSPGWFRDGQGLFCSEDDEGGDEGADIDDDNEVHIRQNTDLVRRNDPFGPTSSSSKLFMHHNQPARASPPRSPSRFSSPQTICSTFTRRQNTSATPSRTTVWDAFELATPSTPTPIRFNSTTLLHLDNQRSPQATAPSASSITTSATGQKPGTIVSQTLAVLSKHKVYMSPAAKQELVALLNTHHLRTQGITKGRDISRVAIQSRDAQIQRLKARIEVLEAEREGFRLGRLRRDLPRYDHLDMLEQGDDG